MAAAEVKQEDAKNDVNIFADQDVAEWHRRGYYGGYWRGRRSAEEIKPEEPAVAADISADQEANEWHDRRYHGYYSRSPYGYYGHYGHLRGRRSLADEEKSASTDDQEVNEWYDRSYYGYPHGYRNYYGRYGPYYRQW